MEFTVFNILVTILISLLTGIYLWARHNATYWKRNGIPNAGILPIFGNFLGIVTGQHGVVDIFNEMYYHKNGEGSPIYGTNVFHKPAIIIKDPELIKQVLIKDFNLFVKRYSGSNLSSDKIGGNILLFLKSLKWRALRAKLSPTFSSAKLKQMFYLKDAVGQELSSLLKKNVNKKSEVEITDIVARYTTDVIATCAFGIQANSLKDPDSEFRTHGKRVFDTAPYRAIELLATFYVPQVVKFFNFKVYSKESTAFFKSTIPEVMDERQKTGIIRNDFLDTLVSFRKLYADQKTKNLNSETELIFDDDLLISQSAVFFTAGFETSSSTVSFCLYELARHPEIQEKLRTEIKEALQKNEGVVSYDMIDGLEYLTMVFSETLRLYPSLTNLDRIYENPDTSKKYSLSPYHDFEIPHGMPVLIPVKAIHMDPKYHPEPTKFNPDRFLDKSILNNGTYMPFGLGPRKCIGDRFGMIQSKVGLVYILKDNYVAANARTPKVLQFDKKAVLLKADGGIWLDVIKDN